MSGAGLPVAVGAICRGKRSGAPRGPETGGGVRGVFDFEKIRRIHGRINNRHVKESGQYANDAESSWYMGNGFNRKQVGEYYEYSKEHFSSCYKFEFQCCSLVRR